jgi:TfoX/Sxy family transcriptional regulator of competence genes
MGTTREAADAIVAFLEPFGDIRIRGMMGGWLVYSDDVLIAQVNEGELFLKPTAATEDFTAHLKRRPPYPGAKPAILVPVVHLQDRDWVQSVIELTTGELRKKR